MSQIKTVTRVFRTVERGFNRAEFNSLPNGTQSTRAMSAKALTLHNMNPDMYKLKYAVKGPLVLRAMEIEKELQRGDPKPFDKIIKASVGDAQAMGQPPITFIRQVLALVSHPYLIDKVDYPQDVKDRALEFLNGCEGTSVGAYSVCQGMELVRRRVAEHIERRDGHPSRWEDICITSGASTGIKICLELFSNNICGKPSGVLIPIPQFPLYSATLVQYGISQVGYYLDEDSNWALDLNELEQSLTEASTACNVRALVVINPGNPTGQLLTRENIESIIKFAHKHSLFIFADEVYQDNVYAKGSEFHSFKKVMCEMGAPYSNVELASFMSVSKGFTGECGLRGGWMELVNMDRGVQHHLYKCISAMLCSSTLGQAAVFCKAKHPQPGEPSYELFDKEKSAVLKSLQQRAEMITETFNEMKGIKCNVVQGAMYAFPRVELPPRAVEVARKQNMAPDEYYALQLLEHTGICVVPGTGFGQRPNTYHFRVTILPRVDLLKEMLDTFKRFHKIFIAELS